MLPLIPYTGYFIPRVLFKLIKKTQIREKLPVFFGRRNRLELRILQNTEL